MELWIFFAFLLDETQKLYERVPNINWTFHVCFICRFFEGQATRDYVNFSFALLPASTYLLRVSNGNTKAMRAICSKLGIKIPESYQKDVNGMVLMLLLLTLNRFHTLFSCFHCWLWTSKYWLSLYLYTSSRGECSNFEKGAEGGGTLRISDEGGPTMVGGNMPEN